jgi:photosystem II stability/assembly factor-like uncharacterized protein
MMRLLKRTILTILSIGLIASGAGAESSKVSWHPAGYGGGGRFTAVAVDPANPQMVYVGSDVAGVYRSRDGGNRFDLAGKGLEGFAVADIAVNPAAPHQVVALTDDGLYYSLDQAATWVRLSREIRYPSRFFGSRLLLFTRHSLWVGTDAKGIFRLALDNLKASPQAVRGLELVKVNGLAVHDGYLHAGTSHGVYRLEGQSWKQQLKGFSPDSLEITDIAASQKSLYAVEKQKGLFRWSEAAGAWENRPVSGRPQAKGFKSLFVDPDNPDLVLLGSHPENWPHLLYKTRDGGSTWKSIETYQGYRTQDGGSTWESARTFQTDPAAPVNWTSTLSGAEKMTFVPGTSQTLFMTDWWNLWWSSDAGESWLQKHRGLQNTCINDLKIHPRNPAILYLCAADNGLMISADAGKTWKRAMQGVADGHAQEIEISQKDPSRMVLLMNPWDKKGKVYLYESRNAGATWRDIGFSLPPGALPKKGYVDGLATNVELDPLSEETIYVGTNGYGVYKTVNGGKDWLPMNRGLDTPYIKGPGALRVHPQSPRTLFASTQAGGIYKSTDGAGSWQRVTRGERFTFGMAIDPKTPSRILAGSSGNTLLLSSDEGKSWQEIKIPLTASAAAVSQTAIFAVAFHPKRAGLVLAGTLRYDTRATEGLFVSTDGARTFRLLPMDIPQVNIHVITLTEREPAAGYVGFNGTGVFRVELGENP